MNKNLSDYTKTSSTLNWGYKYFKKKHKMMDYNQK